MSSIKIPGNLDELTHFIDTYSGKFQPETLGGSHYQGEKFDIDCRSFIQFAGRDLNINTVEAHVSVVTNLKRALDCQIDTYFLSLGLHGYLKKKNIKIAKKLEMLSEMGFLNPRSLDRLNLIRNKIEHHYQSPNDEDIALFFDLVTAYVEILESAKWEPNSCSYEIDNSGVHISLCYKKNVRSMAVYFFEKQDGQLKWFEELTFPISESVTEFAQAFKILRQSVRSFLAN